MSSRAIRYRRAPGAPFRYLDDDVIVAPPGTDTFESLAGTAADVWSLLDAPRTLDDLVVVMTQAYSANADQLKTDISALLERLMAAGSIRIVDHDDR